LSGADALLLLVLPLPLPTAAVLALRTVEGGAHVGSATLLIAAMAARGSRGGRSMGLAGAAIMAAVALRSALGGLLLQRDPRAPSRAASVLAAAAAIYGPRRCGADPHPESRPPLRELLAVARTLAAPLGLAFAARFSIGCLIVTFALLVHARHGLDDSTVGLLFSSMLVPFAAATYPVARLGTRVPPAGILGGGAFLWAACLPALGWARTWALFPTMVAGGLASAFILAPILGYAAAAPGGRAQAMALVNSASCLGMVLGPAAAGITIALLRRAHAAEDA